MPRPLLFLRLVLLLVLCFAAPTVRAQQYAVTNLGTLGSFTSSHALGINNNGQIVGYGILKDNTVQTFVCSKGRMTFLNSSLTSSVSPYALNSLGTVTGELNNLTAFRTSFGSVSNPDTDSLGTLGGSSCGYAINDVGQVAGMSTLDANGQVAHAFLWSPEGVSGPVSNPQMQDLGTLGGNYTQATGVNNAGQVVGFSGPDVVANPHAFLWTAGGTGGPASNPQMVDLGFVSPFDTSRASAINASGQILVNEQATNFISGSSYQASAFLYTPAVNGTFTITALGNLYGYDLSQALALDTQGQVVGRAGFVHSSSSVGTLFMNGAAVDLNQLMPYPYNVTSAFHRATGINDLGLIVGDGGNDSDQALLLTPALLAAPISLTFSPSLVAGDQSTTGTVTLSGPAPAGGATVSLTEDGQDAGTVSVAQGQTSATFPLTFPHVSAQKQVAVDATRNGVTFETVVTVNPPPPVLSTLTPSSVMIGAPDLALTLTGSNFTPTCVVQQRVGYSYTSTSLATNYVSPTQLIVTIPAAEMAASNSIYISVLDTVTNSLTSYQILTVNAPTPTLSVLSPVAAAAGSSALTLTLTGTNFISSTSGSGGFLPGSYVRWNTQTLTTTYVSATQLTASVPATSLVSGGVAQVTVINPSPGGGASNALTFTIIAPPTTTVSLSGTVGSNGWYKSPVQVTLSATIAAGGASLAATYYTVDGGPLQTYSVPFTVSGDASHTVTFWSADSAGNTESAHTKAVQIDVTPPTMTFGAPTPAPNAAGWNNAPTSISCTPGDATSGVFTMSYGTPVRFATEGAGQTQAGTVTDVAGNIAAFSTPVVNIDLTAPITTASVNGAVVTLTASDALSGVAATYYKVDSGTQQTYSTPFTVVGVGTHTVTFWSVDVASNTETTKTKSVAVNDTLAPITTASLSGTRVGNLWYNSAVQVTLSAADNTGGSGVASTFYAVDGGTQQTYSAPFTVSGDGTHTVIFYSIDNVGNTETTKAQSVPIDATPPTLIFGTPSPTPNAAGWNNGTVILPYTASDATSGVASATPGSVLTFAGEGASQTQTVTVTDNAGNGITLTTPAVNIDLTAPATTATVNGTTVTLAATDTLSGVAATYCTIDGGAQIAYAAPFAVTGSGTHTVTFWSVDVAGNAESPHSATVTVAAPITVIALSLSPTSVKGGAATSAGTVILSGPAPSGGLAVKQTSSDMSSATLAPTLNIPAGATSAKFKITTYAVTGMRTVTIMSSANGSSQTAALTVTGTPPVTVTALSLSPASVLGGSSSTATVTLSAPAPSGGTPVTLQSSDTASATAPASVTVASGQTTSQFSVMSKAVAVTKTVTVTATLGSSSQGATLTVTPSAPLITVLSLSLSPTSVKGGASSTGTITLSGPAPTGGVSITQTSSDTTAATLAPKLNIAAGATSAKFKITTYAVTSTKTVTVMSALNGASKAQTLTVTH